MTDNITTTTNGMTAYKSSLNDCVDLFYAIGASRGQDIIPKFKKAFSENPDMALRIALWTRDVRGGAGERKLFREILLHLSSTSASSCRALMVKIPELGRWDDMLALMDTPMEKSAMTLIKNGLLVEKDQLCSKWMPRKGLIAIKLRKFMDMTPKQYRKTLVNLTDVVETKMCAKEWGDINFSKLPSLASARYQKAFAKNAELEYQNFKDQLSKGEVTINSDAVYPYDIIKSLAFGDKAVANAQWNALPDYMEGSTQRIIPLVDVSGSMYTPIDGNSNLTGIDIAISLGLYISERSKSIFKDKFITFSANPAFVSVEGDLNSRYNTMEKAEWGMSTNIIKAFKLILDSAIMHNVHNNDMPTKLLILSDMQFNYGVKHADTNAMTELTCLYEKAGYTLPDIIFWNIINSNNMPVTFNTNGVALVSGFSPSLMKSILSSDILSPLQTMKNVVCVERYDCE